MTTIQLRLAALLSAVFMAACGGSSTSPANPPLTVDVGGCCGDTCSSNVCAPTLHCGSGQAPIAVFLCCANGSFCCGADSDCQPYYPGGACNQATKTCYTDCATNDDSRCAADYHCEGSSCVADEPNFATTCDEPSDCASGNCSAAFDPGVTTSTCAPADSCADGTASYPVGYTLCSGNLFARRCEAAGRWSVPTANPNPTGVTCEADGSGDPLSGFQDPATCTSGLDGADPGFTTTLTCESCFPFHATSSGCITNCGDNDASCRTGYHCALSAGGVCATDADGSACDVDTECASGRCDGTCMPKLANGLGCDEDSDCTSGWCDGIIVPGAGPPVCANRKPLNALCSYAFECDSRHCATEFDPVSANRFCAPAGSCVRNGNSYPLNWVQCDAGQTDSTYTRICGPYGWITSRTFGPSACADGALGANAGYTTVAACASGDSTTTSVGPTLVCNTCGGFGPLATFLGCRTGCTGVDDAACASTYYCDGTSCVADLANAATCTRDTECASGRCDTTCMDRLADGGLCDEPSDCISGLCGAGTCYTPGASCPYVFSWNGGAYEYENDVQGPIIGNPRFASRVPLYSPHAIVLPALQPDLLGDYRVKLREALPEIDYVDEVKLLVVDFPAGHELLSSSAEDTYRMGFVPPFALYTAKDPVLPLAATDQSGADILASVSTLDGVVAPAAGVHEPVYTFDFGPIADPAQAKLVIDGWAVIGPEYGSTTSLTSYVEVVDATGAWVKARNLGFPSGDLKPMAISLAGLFRSSDHRVRLHVGRAANSRWVVDRIRLDTSASVPVDVVAELAPATATLRERGAFTHAPSSFARRITALDDTRDLITSALGFGAFTRLGEVSPLLASMDDTYVVMRHGDELELTFTGGLPAPAPGMQRAYVAKFSLFYKNFDVSNDVAPMPFHAMSTYPYGAAESFPSDVVHDTYQGLYNTRVYSR